MNKFLQFILMVGAIVQFAMSQYALAMDDYESEMHHLHSAIFIGLVLIFARQKEE